MTRYKVFEAINSERDWQDRKWGTIEQHPHEVGGWLTLMRKLLSDAELAWSTSSGDYNALQEIRKVIAVGVACGEQHGLETRSKHQSREIAQANARLIIAAPDLLEACKAAKKYLEPDLIEPGRTVFWNLVAAITKAEGKVDGQS